MTEEQQWPNQLPVVKGVQEVDQDPELFNDDVVAEEDE